MVDDLVLFGIMDLWLAWVREKEREVYFPDSGDIYGWLKVWWWQEGGWGFKLSGFELELSY